jgi:hypothetical protein
LLPFAAIIFLYGASLDLDLHCNFRIQVK